MANTPTPGAPAHAFSLSDAVSLMRQAAYGRPESQTRAVDLANYSAAFDHLDALSNASYAVKRCADGLAFLCALMTEGDEPAGLERYHSESISGLLLPIERELRHHYAALRAALGYTRD